MGCKKILKGCLQVSATLGALTIAGGLLVVSECNRITEGENTFEEVPCRWKTSKNMRKCFKKALTCNDPVFAQVKGDQGFDVSEETDEGIIRSKNKKWGGVTIRHRPTDTLHTVFAACDVENSPFDFDTTVVTLTDGFIIDNERDKYESCYSGGSPFALNFMQAYGSSPKKVRLKIGEKADCSN